MSSTTIRDSLGLAEAAALLRLPYGQAHREVLVGKLTGYKVGHFWRVDRRSVEALLKERERGASTE